MWRKIREPACHVDDFDAFMDVLNRNGSFFDQQKDVICARAPSRLDLMGGIADYSGSLALELPLQHATYACVQQDESEAVTCMSTAAADIDSDETVAVPLSAIAQARQSGSYDALRHMLTADPRKNWAAYVAGVAAVLAVEKAVPLTQGLRIMVHSFVPPASGISSSAALEVAAMQAAAAALGLELDGRECAVLCQKVENHVVGAPCGVMDQMSSACGKKDSLLVLLCQPAELFPALHIPDGYEVWGINSGIRHAVSGSDYGSVRTGAFMGYRICADIAGFPVTSQSDGLVVVDDPEWNGYLANMTPSVWNARYRDHVPESMTGAAFLERYEGVSDPVSRIDPETTYAIRMPTAHPVHEHFRVSVFKKLMEKQSQDEETATVLGECMYQSHASYSACKLGSDGTDMLVDMVRRRGAAKGLYGAKITGGGSGGTVAVLARKGLQDELERLTAEYEQRSGRSATLIGGSSPGAAEFGTCVAAYTSS
jgi:L-arabinokinase